VCNTHPLLDYRIDTKSRSALISPLHCTHSPSSFYIASAIMDKNLTQIPLADDRSRLDPDSSRLRSMLGSIKHL